MNIDTLRVFEAFAGYGSQSMALERLRKSHPGFDYQVVGKQTVVKQLSLF